MFNNSWKIGKYRFWRYLLKQYIHRIHNNKNNKLMNNINKNNN